MKEVLVRWSTECLVWICIAAGLGVPIYLFGLSSWVTLELWRLVGYCALAIFGVGWSCAFFYIRQQWRAAGCPDTMRINL